jgi:hypothetical protein
LSLPSVKVGKCGEDLIGRTYVNCEGPAREANAETSEFAAVPPEMTTTFGDVGVGGVPEPRSMFGV